MSMGNGKLRLIHILKILTEESSALSPISAVQLSERLAELGISTERKAIYDDVEVLTEAGYDIRKSGGSHRGYYIAERTLGTPELCLLIDAVQSAGFISADRTRELIEKLEGLASRDAAEVLKRRVCIDNRSKTSNENVYSIISSINDAIQSNRKIKICYRRNVLNGTELEYSEKNMTVSPYALIWDSDHYYLVCNNQKYDNLMHLRVDRIKSVKEVKETCRHFSEVSEYKQRFDTADYAKKTFNMFGGEVQRIDLECDITLLDQMTDRFGRNIFIRHRDKDNVFRFSTDATVSDGLIGWLLQFGDRIKVLSPAAVRDAVKECAEKTARSYS